MNRIDSITVTTPPRREFTFTWLGKEETEVQQLPPCATLCRGISLWRTYWNVTRSSLARLHRAQVALAHWEADNVATR